MKVFISSAFLILALSSLAMPNQANAKTFYLSLVKKNTVSSFLSRMATDNHHIVLTESKPKSVVKSVELEASQIQHVGIFELEPKQTAPDEAACIERICIAKKNLNFHGNHIHFQDIDAKPMQTLEPLPPRKENFFIAPQKITIDSRELKKMLNQLTGEENVVVDGETIRLGERASKEGRDKARTFLAQEYSRYGYTVTTEEFGSRWRKGKNLVAEKRGTNPEKIFLVTSHMDTVRTAGADDDGSGTISAIAIAKALKDFQPNYTIRFVAFDLEENGLIGSRAYARLMDQRGEMQNMIGLINLEMTAYDSDNDGAYHVIDCNENTSAQLSEAVESVVANYDIKLVKKHACTNRSDHAIFWRYNRPAIVVSQNYFRGDANPCYHRRCDTTANLNFDYMSRLTSSVAMAIRNLLL